MNTFSTPTVRVWTDGYDRQDHENITLDAAARILAEEAKKDYNLIGLESGGIQMLVVFRGDKGVVSFGSMDGGPEWVSYDKTKNANVEVRMSPDDLDERSFQEHMIIAKSAALALVNKYLASGQRPPELVPIDALPKLS